MHRALPFVLVLALGACSSGAPETERSAAEAETAAGATPAPADSPTPMPPGASLSNAPPAPKPVPAELPGVMARVNGYDITRAEFERAVGNLEGRAGGPVPASERDRIYRGVLDELIAYRLLLQETQARKIEVPDADVNARFDEVRKQFPTEEAFAAMLKSQQLTPDQARSELRNELRVSKLIETEIAPNVAVNETQVAAFYEQNPSQFQLPQQVRASHILIAAPTDADPAARTAARERAAGLLKRVRAGEDFAALAREFSQDSGSAANGGDLGFFPEGETVKPFNDAAFSLKPGTVSDIVETEYGFHIIKVVERQAARSVSLDEARPSITQYLEAMNRREHTQAFLRALRDKGKVDVFI